MVESGLSRHHQRWYPLLTLRWLLQNFPLLLPCVEYELPGTALLHIQLGLTLTNLGVIKTICFASTDWNVFRDSSDGIEEYTTSVTGFINKCIKDVVPTVTVRTV